MLGLELRVQEIGFERECFVSLASGRAGWAEQSRAGEGTLIDCGCLLSTLCRANRTEVECRRSYHYHYHYCCCCCCYYYYY